MDIIPFVLPIVVLFVLWFSEFFSHRAAVRLKDQTIQIQADEIESRKKLQEATDRAVAALQNQIAAQKLHIAAQARYIVSLGGRGE